MVRGEKWFENLHDNSRIAFQQRLNAPEEMDILLFLKMANLIAVHCALLPKQKLILFFFSLSLSLIWIAQDLLQAPTLTLEDKP